LIVTIVAIYIYIAVLVWYQDFHSTSF
jgi:hypothetical protein